MTYPTKLRGVKAEATKKIAHKVWKTWEQEHPPCGELGCDSGVGFASWRNPEESCKMLPNVEDHSFSDELPEDDGEDTPVILAEMEALQAIFDVDFQEGPLDRAVVLAKHALELKSPPSSTEGRVTVVSLSHCLGNPRLDLAMTPPALEGTWVQKTFETLASGWMRWLTAKDKTILKDIALMHHEEGDEDDGAVETLSLNFWARAIELLVQEERDQAKRFFERATEVGSQFGTRSNPTICWSYAASFFPIAPKA